MHINLLNNDNIEGKGLSVLLGNEGHQVDQFTQNDKPIQVFCSDKSSSLLLINIEILNASDATPLLERLNTYNTILLLGKLHQLHWLTKFSTPNKGFICKDSTFAELHALLQGLKKGQSWCDRSTQNFLQKNRFDQQKTLLKCPLKHALSKKELIVMQDISDGKTAKQVAQKQYLSVHTIYNHRKNIIQKFDDIQPLKLSKFCMLRYETIRTLILVDNKEI